MVAQLTFFTEGVRAWVVDERSGRSLTHTLARDESVSGHLRVETWGGRGAARC